MTTATPRLAAEQDSPPIRATYRRYSGVRTRVLTVDGGLDDPFSTDSVLDATSSSRPRRPQRDTHPSGARNIRYVLFHGYCDNADTWRPLMQELAASGDAAIAVDLPGFGDADPLRPGQILPQLDAFVRAVVKRESRHGNVVLVGNSLGGTASLRAAQNAKLPIAGVVSIAAPGVSDTWLVNTIRRFPLPLRLYGALPLPIPRPVIRGIADAVVPRLLYADHHGRGDTDSRRFVDLFTSNTSVRERLAQAKQLTSEFDENLYEPDRITAPLLILTCGKDKLVRADSGQRLHTLIPHSRLVVREDWGHCPQLDDPEQVHHLLTFFGASCRRVHTRTADGRSASAAS